ncbi:MAG: ribosomal protein [Candidatus Berkelbacteria bacterium]|nr:ribosomal protein [Candidatus Berkelbacteria bacterium]
MDKCAKCRKFQTKLFLKGDRCVTPKCALTRRNYRPGQHGPKTTSPRRSEYGLQLLEKQKAKAEYGMRERQFSNLFSKAGKSRKSTGEELLKLLELRLDNVIYRIGWAKSRAHARQLITHRFFTINENTVNIPSYSLKMKDIIKQRKHIELIKTTVPKWIKIDPKNTLAEISREPAREEIETDLDEQLIIEFYSR